MRATLLLAAMAARASNPPVQPANPLQAAVHDTDEASQNEDHIRLVDERIAKVTAAAKEKALMLHRLRNGAGAPRFLWESPTEARQAEIDGRKRLERLLQIALRSQLHELEILQVQKGELHSEREWIRIQSAEVKAKSDEASGRAAAHAEEFLRCASLPAEADSGQSLKILQDFGRVRDSETGIEWQSLGWWLGGVSSHVHACADGVVAFVGHVQGRGRVVMLDHGGGRMTLYGNLNEDPTLQFKKGSRVARGAALGVPQGKLYFEARKDGHALNPREVLAPAELARFGL